MALIAPKPKPSKAPPKRPKTRKPPHEVTGDELLALARQEFELALSDDPQAGAKLEEVTEKLNSYARSQTGPGLHLVRTARDIAAEEQRKKRETRQRALDARRARMTYTTRVPATTRNPSPKVLDELLESSQELQDYVTTLVTQLRRHDELVAPLVADYLGTM